MRYKKAQADIIFLIIMLFIVVVAVFLMDVIKNDLFNSPAFQAVSNATATGQLAVKQANSAINILNDAVAFLCIFALESPLPLYLANGGMVYSRPFVRDVFA